MSAYPPHHSSRLFTSTIAPTLVNVPAESSAGKDSPVRLFTNAGALGLPVGQLFPLPCMSSSSDDEADGECYKYTTDLLFTRTYLYILDWYRLRVAGCSRVVVRNAYLFNAIQ